MRTGILTEACVCGVYVDPPKKYLPKTLAKLPFVWPARYKKRRLFLVRLLRQDMKNKRRRPGLTINVEENKPKNENSPQRDGFTDTWWRTAYMRPGAGHLGVQPSGNLLHLHAACVVAV